jgi:transcriptional regulator with XRE-family HTH domain
MPGDSVGQRVAQLRRLRGRTQPQLAADAGVSLSLVRRVEQGQVPATPAFIAAAARALHSSPAELQGQPFRGDTPDSDRVHAAIGPLRAEVALAGIPEDDIAARPAAELRDRVAAASHLAHQVQLVRLGNEVPGLLADLRTAAAYAGHSQAGEIHALLAETWGNARMIARVLGYPDLAQAMTERYAQAAERSGDPYAAAIGAGLRAAELIQVGRAREAAALLEAARRATGEPGDLGPQQAWAAWGWSHLQSALAAARGTGDPATASAHLEQAARAAEHLPDDADHYRMTVNRANVAIWSVGLAVELGDGARAVRLAAAIGSFTGVTPNRISHHYIDLARGHLYAGDRNAALDSLMTARKHAPQQTRYHPQVRETVRALTRLERRRTDSLAAFTSWLGV